MRPRRRRLAWISAAGACLPDVPYLARALSLAARRGRRLSVAEAMTELDYVGTPDWKPDLAVHSLVPIAALLGLAGAARSETVREDVRAFAAGWAGHNLIDLATHSSDARPHLWPLSRRRWRSPVSYWDRRHHALAVLALEHMLVVGLLCGIAARRPGLGGLGLLGGFIRHPRQVGAVLPTSLTTVNAMLDMTDWSRVERVAELGAGTGVFTGELLRRVGPDGEVIAFEIDPRLADGLAQRFDDPRLRIVNDSAELLAEELRGGEVDVVVSALPFTSLPAAVRERVLLGITETLRDGGVMLAIQYSRTRERDFERHFASLRTRRSLRNVPPALLYACYPRR